jgi:hypothetical protein
VFRLFEAGDLGTALKPPVGPRQSPKLLNFRDLNHVRVYRISEALKEVIFCNYQWG